LEEQIRFGRLSSADERRLVQQIDTLKRSKRLFDELQKDDDSISAKKIEATRLREAADLLWKAVGETRKATKVFIEELETIKAEQAAAAGNAQSLEERKAKRAAAKEKLDQAFKDREELRAKLKAHIDAFYQKRKEDMERKRREWEEERVRRDAERKRYLEERRRREEEEQLKFDPYAVQKETCERLVAYLQGIVETRAKAAAQAAVAEAKVVEPPPGYVVVKREAEDGVQPGRKCKSKKKASAAAAGAEDSQTLSHALQTIGDFVSVSVSAPATAADLASAVEALRAQQVRDSRVTCRCGRTDSTCVCV
jgi:hypothetical protein